MARILIVDDESTDRMLERAILEDAGHELFVAADGKTALAAFREHSIDLVITDIVMPKLGGLEFIYQIRQVNPDAKIIAVSGVSRESLEIATERGAVETIFKPVKRDELLDAVKRALG